MEIDLGMTDYHPGDKVIQSSIYVDMLSEWGQYADESFVPIGYDMIVKENLRKHKKIFMTRVGVCEVLYLDNLPLALKVYGNPLICRVIDTHVNKLLSKLDSNFKYAVVSSNDRHKSMFDTYGYKSKEDDLYVNKHTSSCDGVVISDESVLLHKEMNNSHQTYPYRYHSDSKMEHYVDRILAGCSIIGSTVPNVHSIDPVRTPVPTDIPRVNQGNGIDHQILKTYMSDFYECEFTDIYMKITPREIEFVGTNRLLGLQTTDVPIKCIELSHVLRKLYSTAKEIVVVKTFEENGWVTVTKPNNNKQMFYFDIASHLMCRCSIEHIWREYE